MRIIDKKGIDAVLTEIRKQLNTVSCNVLRFYQNIRFLVSDEIQMDRHIGQQDKMLVFGILGLTDGATRGL